MSDRPLEYLKRTCLICGCHTNQTINIYEPRSGPNIVQLIQAKFKFQPLNEDKYLCFSCNNWLINWHSLQAVNSNDAENGSHVNSMAPQKGADGQHKATCRPIAQVKPRRINETKTMTITNSCAKKFEKLTQPCSIRKKLLSRTYAKQKYRYPKRIFSRFTKLKIFKTSKNFNLYKRSNHLRISQNLQKYKQIKYLSCRQLKKIFISKKTEIDSSNITSDNIDFDQRNHLIHLYPTKNENEYLKRPIVDGKIVSMLRRLGTSLTRETKNTMLPPIMSPPKTKPRWTRPLEKDEILLSFDADLSEVLPNIQTNINQININMKMNTDKKPEKTFSRKLSYQNEDAITVNHNHNIQDKNPRFEQNCLPEKNLVLLV